MTRALRLSLLSAMVAATAAAQSFDLEPVVRSAPVIVAESRLLTEAAGATHVSTEGPGDDVDVSFAQVFDRVANLHVSPSGAGSFGGLFSLRGLSNTPYFSDPAVAVYLDDLPLSGGFMAPTDVFGFASATVLRGPQGTRLGRSGDGGVVILNSALPSAAATGEARASFGNFNHYAGGLLARSAANQTTDVSASASYSSRDGYIENTQLGTDVDHQEALSGSARVRYRPTRTSEFALQVLGQRVRNGAQPLVPLGGPLFEVHREREGATEIDFGGAALKAAFDTALGRLSATTSYTDWTLRPFTNELVLPPPLDSSLAQSQRAWNEEIRLTSAAQAAVPWLLGVWWSDVRTNGDVTREIPHLFPIESSSFASRARTAAVFAEAVAIGDASWRITAGVRAERVVKTIERDERIPTPGAYASERTFKSLSPRVAGTWTIAPDTHASASFSEGQRPGGWSAYTAYPSLARFQAERTRGFEAGIDTMLAGRAVTLALRGFSYSIRNYQIERSFTPADYIVVNAPRARSTGGEIEATWRASSQLTFAASLGVTRATLREFTDPFTGVAYDGRRAPYTPSFNASVNATYRLTSGWFAAAELTTTGRTCYDETEDLNFAQSRRSLVDARLGYAAARWRLSVYGANLSDESYYALIVPGVGHAVPGAPRTYGIEAMLKW